MGFYYVSIFSLMLLGVFYAVALIGLWLWWTKRRQRPFKGPAVWSAIALVLVAPWLEELWIAWNFGQLCRKDAGIVVNKTVEVEGYYDASAGLLQINKPVLPVTAENFDKRGYKFYEMSLANTKGGPSKVARFEKIGGEWTGAVLDKPTARYHYRWPHMDTPMSHKVDKIERVVVDSQTEEVLARETKYRREAPWFYIGLDRPVMLCPAPGEHPLSRHGSVFNLALKPKQDR